MANQKLSERFILSSIYSNIRSYYGVYLIFGYITLLFLINRNLFIINPYMITIDPWLYTGYFLNFEYFYQTFGILYYGTRVSWIIPGYILYHIFPTTIANYILHFGFVIVAVFSLYYILKHSISNRIAIFTALLFGGYVFFLNQMGWDYVSGSGMTFFLLSMVFLTLSDNSQFQKYYLFFAGCFSISMIYANIFTIVFTPTLLAYFIYIHYEKKLMKTISQFLNFIVGIFVGSALMELFVYMLTGYKLILLKQYSVGNYLVFDANNPYFEPIESWILSANWLYFPLIVCIGCIVFLLIQFVITRKIIKSYNLFFILNFLLTLIIYIGLYLMGRCSLQLAYYACFLIPPMFLAIGALCSDAIDSLTQKQFFILTGVELCLLLLPYSSFNSAFKSWISVSGVTLFLLFFTSFWIIFFVYSALSKKVKKSKLCMVIILLVVLSMTLFNGLYYDLSLKNYPDNYENGFEAVTDSAKIIDDNIDGNMVRFWYNASEKGDNGIYGGIFNNINAVYMWGYSRIGGGKFPLIDERNAKILSKEHPIIVISSTKGDVFTSANISLNEWGLHSIKVSEKSVKKGNISFNLTFIKIGGQFNTI